MGVNQSWVPQVFTFVITQRHEVRRDFLLGNSWLEPQIHTDEEQETCYSQNFHYN
jgi:hypothetical protein